MGRMSIRTTLLTLAFATSALVGRAIADDHPAHDGEEMNVHNNTGHEVLVFLFQDANVHLNEKGGTQFAHLKTGESAVAHVPHCTFSVILIDHDDIWHAEFHDCHSTDLTFTKDTGHAHRK
jgi:hypothetical protein